jgi:hypothetical protein
MKKQFIVDLDDRKRQVKHYLLVVATVERKLKFGPVSRVQEGRLLTLRAGAFLVLYNLIESSTRAGIEAIHSQIISEGVSLPLLNEKLRKEVIIRFRKSTRMPGNDTAIDFSSAFVALALAQDEGIKISGSVDAKKIRSFGDRYGFSCVTDKIATRDGSDLVEIKQNRNDLAHGLKTYEEVGRDYTSRDLMMLSKRSMAYITAISYNIARYLESAAYLA